jgi:hypothetical protein
MAPSTLGDLYDELALVRIQPDEAVDSVFVRRQLDRLGVDERLPNDVGLVVGTELAQRIAHPDLIHERYA